MRKLLMAAVLLSGIAAFGNSIKMRGKFVWMDKGEDKENGKLEAVFTPTEKENTYDAVFTFDWKGKDMKYVGVVNGNLTSGPVTGEINNNEKGKALRTFEFTAEVERGKLVGTHRETTKKRPVDTGTFTLK